MGMEAHRMRRIQQHFKLRGLALTQDALLAVVDYLDGSPAVEKEALASLLTPLQSLIGCAGATRYVMGAISQLEDGRFSLEDFSATGAHHVTTAGLFTENSIVVAEGELLPSGTFQARALGFPPLEAKEESLALTDGIDFWGCGSINLQELDKLRAAEAQAVDDMFVVISDVHLDSEEAMQKIAAVLDGYEGLEVVPSLFIFCGNFCSQACNLGFHDYARLKEQFGRLGLTIAAHRRILEGARFLFVPGPGDAGPASVLPRPALPKMLQTEVTRHLPNAVFASNPCRIRFYAQDIVVFRDDLQHRMRRSCVVKPSEDETSDPFQHLVVTALQQSHLCPLPLTTQPIFWEYDHALRLYPVPDVVIFADRAEQNRFVFEGVTCFNPGPFTTDSTFVAYRPATREVLGEISCKSLHLTLSVVGILGAVLRFKLQPDQSSPTSSSTFRTLNLASFQHLYLFQISWLA
eukprot:jgi/Mesen1/3349/ME000191S02482